jgi:hypothetical protein
MEEKMRMIRAERAFEMRFPIAAEHIKEMENNGSGSEED